MESKEMLVDRLNGPILSRLRQAVALFLWESRAVRVNVEDPFRLASGNRSPIYINCRCVISDPEFMRLYCAVAAMILDRRQADFSVIAGGETAGIPYAVALGQAMAKSVVYVRKQAKGHGLANRVEGALAAGSRVLLAEDLITDGGSKWTFLDAIEEAGGKVTDALVLFDREQGGTEKLASRGVRLHSVTDRRTTFAVGHSAGLLDEVSTSSIEDYFRDPARWHEARGFTYLGDEPA